MSGRDGAWAVVAALAVGAMLRGYQLLDQIPIDDEWHAIHHALVLNARGVFAVFGTADASIPLAVYYKALMATVGLGEVGLRLPSFLAGLAAIAVLPLAARRTLGLDGASTGLFAWLIALSPLMIFHSRFARPYALIAFGALAAALAFLAWWRTGRARWALAYLALATGCAWLSLSAAAFVLAPFAFFGGAALLGREDPIGRAFARLAALGLATALMVGAVLAPPLYHDARSLLVKAAVAPIHGVDLDGGAVFALGFGQPWIALLLLALALVGLLARLRDDLRHTGFLVFLAAASVGVLFAVRPTGSDIPVVVARYLMPVWVVALLFAACGAVAVAEALRFGRWLRGAAAGAAVLVLFATGPYPAIAQYPNGWLGHWLGRDRAFMAVRSRERLLRVPAFYRELAAHSPGSITIVEASGNRLTYDSPLPAYQRIHRQNVRVGYRNGLCGEHEWGELPWNDRRAEFRNAVFLADIESARAAGVDYVVFHPRLGDEVRNAPRWVREGPDLSACIAAYRERVGPPSFEDQTVVVFDLRAPRL